MDITYKKYIYENQFVEVDNDSENVIQCDFCTGTYFTLITKGNKQYLECRCGNKISPERFQTIRKSEVENYQKLLESIGELKDEFLFKIRGKHINTFEERVGIYVDIQNVYYGAKDSFKSKVDFKKMIDNVLRDRRLVVANAYLIDSNIDNKKFLSCLHQLGYTLKIKSLRVRHDGSSKGNSDIEMVIDVLTEKDNMDTVALVTGDGDFVPLVRFLKSKNVRVEVYSFSEHKNSTAFDLKEEADKFYEIDESYLFEGKKAIDDKAKL